MPNDRASLPSLISSYRTCEVGSRIIVVGIFKSRERSTCIATCQASPAAASAASQVTASKTPVSWLPVGADVTVVDDFAHSPVKSKAVASANEHLRKGQPGEAIDTLKVADVNVAYTMALVPMKQTMTDVDKASDLLAQGKYYQADQILKRVVDGVRYDQVDITAVPAASSQKSAQK